MQRTQFHSDIALIKSFVKSWDRLAPEQIKFERLAGLSNMTYKVTALDSMVSPSSVIFRRFGDNSEIIDRDRENYIFQELAKKGLGPSCYGLDQTIRVEEFYDSRVLNSSEVNTRFIRRNLAKNVAVLHKVDLEGLDKKPMILKVLEEGNFFKLVEEKASKDIYSFVEKKWLQEIMSITSEDETNFLLDILPKSKESVVFSHNDLHSQNILVLEKSSKFVFIDYEYSDYNYRGYDIANLFNESMIDYTNPEYPYYTIDRKNFPSDYDLIDFIKYYLFFFKFESGYDEMQVLNDDSYFKEFIEKNYDKKKFNLEVETLFDEVKVCAMLSHYYWILWSIVMSKNPEIQFDYLHYAYDRYQVYQQLKKEYYSSKYPEIETILNQGE